MNNENSIKEIEARIELYTVLEDNARTECNINMTMMYLNQIIGLREALIIVLKNK